jgi:Protein of unknown function (DUF3108)
MDAIPKRGMGVIAQVVLAAILLCPTGVSMAQVKAERIELRTEIFGLGGIHVATNRTRIETSTERYTITADVQSLGIARVIADVTTHSGVSGVLRADELHPEAYRGEIHRNGTDIYNWVVYAADGSATGASSLSAHSPRPVPPGPIAGTIDQLTAFYQMERMFAHRGSCALRVTVFDGLRLYKLHFSDAGSTVLKPSGGAAFAGPAQVCRFEREAIAGFSDIDGRSEGIFEGKLWCARLLGNEMAVPVRMEFGTEFGSVTGELAELHAPATDLRFGE